MAMSARASVLFVVLAFAMSEVAFAQNPLKPSFMPVVDTNAADYPANTWITDTMQKVRQDAGSPGTQHWGVFYGTQNEFIDFQVHVQAPAAGYSSLSVTASDFVQTAPSSYTISASSRNIIVYREAYVNVSIPTNKTSATFYKTTGYYPDILIPAQDPYWGQTTNAWPISIAGNQNQSASIDILVPPSAPSGYYLGAVTVKNGSTVLATMPVILAVWQWPTAQGGQMPSTATLKTFLWNWTYGGLAQQMYNPAGSTYTASSYPGASDNDSAITWIWLDASLLLKDHRYSMGGLTNMYPGSGSFTTWDSHAGPLMNGGCLTHAGHRTVCPLLANSKITTKIIDSLGQNTTAVWQNWRNNFNSSGWGSTLFDYLVDEPNGVSSFQSLTTNAATRHALAAPGVPELVTTDIYFYQGSQAAANTFSTTVCGSPTCIQNSIDIMVPTINVFDNPSGMQPISTYQSWLSRSTNGITRQWWSYLSCSVAGTCSNGVPGPTPSGYSGSVWNYPNYDVDGVPVANRAMEWLTYWHGPTGELYYAGDVCYSPSYYSACKPSGTWDPWNGIYYSGGWGDGTLVYAGSVAPRSINYMGSGVSIPLILPSVRLKHIRDGVQDYEYLNLLTSRGEGSLVQSEISSWITNSYTFETSGSGLQNGRKVLGNAVHELTHPAVLLPPPSLTGTLQ